MNFWTILCILFLSSSSLTDGLRCYKCIRFHCPHDVEVCKQLQVQVTQEAGKYFHLSSPQLSTCPDPSPQSPLFRSWSFMERDRESNCPRGGVCSVSRFFLSPTYTRNWTTGVRLHGEAVQQSYGTILGCPTIEQSKLFGIGNPNGMCVLSSKTTLSPIPLTTFRTLDSSTFRNRMRSKSDSKSDSSRTEGASQQEEQQLERKLQFEHCNINNCRDRDFCIDKSLSTPRKWNLSEQPEVEPPWIGYACLALTLAVLCTSLLVDCCRGGEERAIGGSQNIMQNYQNTFKFHRKKKIQIK